MIIITFVGSKLKLNKPSDPDRAKSVDLSCGLLRRGRMERRTLLRKES